MALEEGDLRAEGIQGKLLRLSSKEATRIKVGNSLSNLLDGQGLGQKIANGKSLRAAIKDSLAAVLGYKIPSGGTQCANDYQ